MYKQTNERKVTGDKLYQKLKRAENGACLMIDGVLATVMDYDEDATREVKLSPCGLDGDFDAGCWWTAIEYYDDASYEHVIADVEEAG